MSGVIFNLHQYANTVRNIYTYIKVKVKWRRYRPGVGQRVGRGIPLLFHDHGTRRGWVVSSTPRPHFTPGKDPVPILQEAGWAPGPVWTGGKSRPHRDSIPDHPSRCQSLYWLSYLTHIMVRTETNFTFHPRTSSIPYFPLSFLYFFPSTLLLYINLFFLCLPSPLFLPFLTFATCVILSVTFYLFQPAPIPTDTLIDPDSYWPLTFCAMYSASTVNSQLS